MIEVNYNRKMLSVEVDGVHFDSLTVSELQGRLAVFSQKYGKNALVELVPCEFSDSEYYLGVFRNVEEDDEDMAFRIAQEEAWATEGKKAAMRQYEHLKKQLGIIE